MSPDRNLLFGILALQNGFVTRDQLVEAMNAWAIARDRPLGDLLRERGALGAEEFSLLDALVQRQIARHHGDVERSLRALDLSSSARDALSSLGAVEGPTGSDLGTPSLPEIPPPPLRFRSAGPRYRVLRPHARGGLGEVFVADDIELHREVALKEIQPQHAGDPSSRGRFLLEAEITGRLEHPGVVPVYGLGAYPDGRPFYAMRFIKGDTLKQAIEQFHKSKEGFATVAFRQLLRRFTDVCNAVAFAHDRGVIHRDIKPGNVMLGPYGETLVVDWGLAKVVGRAGSPERPDDGDGETTLRPSGSGSDVVETRAGAVVGTPAYMSPEQAQGKLDALGPATDVYSLGATFFCVLTGRPPVADGNPVEVLEKVRCGDVLAPRTLRPDVPHALAAVCRKAMAFRPEDRYSTALALAADLERWLADEPVSAYRDPIPARLGRWTRKHRTLVATAAAGLLVSLAGLALGLVVVGGLNQRLEGANAELTQANTKLDAALAQAEKERKVAVAVNEFLRADLLGQADVGNQPGGQRRDPNLTVAELLDRAAKSIGKKFQGEPETEAAIRLTIGDAYQALGKLDEAKPHLERSLALRQKNLGPEHPSTLISKNNLATLYSAQGKFAQAEALLAEVCRAEAKLGADDHAVLLARHNLAELYMHLGKYDRAEQILLEVVPLSEKKYGADHRDTLTSKNVLAKLYAEQGKYGKAEPLQRDVLAQREKTLGADHPAALVSKSDLAWLLHLQGKDGPAEALFVAALKEFEAKLGADHPDTLGTKNNLAIVSYYQAKYDRAAQLFLELARAYEKKLGAEHHSTLTAKNNVAEVYRTQRRYDQAAAMHEEVLRRRERILGEDHPDTLQSLNNLGLSYQALERYDRAETLLGRVQRLFEKKLGADHPSTLTAMNNLAKLYEEQEKYDRAEPLLAEVLKRREKTLGAVHPDTLVSKANLAGLYQRQKRYDEAEPMLREVLQRREEKFGAGHPTTLTSKNSLAELYKERGKYEHAEPLARQAAEGAVKQFGFAHPRTQSYVRDLAGVCEAWGKPEKAQELLQRQLDFLRSRGEADAQAAAAVKVSLGGNLLAQKKYAEAEPLLLQGYEGLVKAAGPMRPRAREERVKEALSGLVRLYEATDKKDEAARWRKKLDEAKK
jgi:serine/threonine protein kinase/tetratricopeptide (TPR) repeat protein